MKTKKYLKIASLAVVAAIFIWTFVFLYRKSQPTVKVYETIVPETADLEKTTVATGKVEPRDEVLIKPQISGIISEVYKEAGQSVKQGEVIAKVKVIPELGTLNSAESRVRLAEINAKQAETDFARVEKLFNDKLISNEEYEKGEVNVKQAREELQTAKDNLEIVKEGITKNSASFSSTLIRSTITGLILDVPIKVGNSVIMSNTFNDGTTIATHAGKADYRCIAKPLVQCRTGIHISERRRRKRSQPIRNQSGHPGAGQRTNPFRLFRQCGNCAGTCPQDARPAGKYG